MEFQYALKELEYFYRVGLVVVDLGWVDFDLDFYQLAQLTSQSCQIGQTVEHFKFKST